MGELRVDALPTLDAADAMQANYAIQIGGSLQRDFQCQVPEHVHVGSSPPLNCCVGRAAAGVIWCHVSFLLAVFNSTYSLKINTW